MAIYTFSTQAIVLTVLLLTIVATMLGYIFGKKTAPSESDRARNIGNAFKASILGMVALLLGFTYSMTYSRFSERQKIVLDEANSIGTCYLRAGLLGEPSKTAIRETLARYTDFRIEYFKSGVDLKAREQSAKAMDKELLILWSQIEESTHREPDITRNSMIVPAANEVIDLSSVRSWTVRNNTPPIVIVLLVLCMVISAVVTGNSFGSVGRFPVVLWIVQTLLTTMILFVILDFDRSAQGVVRVDHVSFVELKEMMGAISGGNNGP